MGSGGRSFARIWPLIFFLFLSGCAETERSTPPPSPLSFEELQQRVSRIRGLAFQYEISLETRPIETIRPVLEKSLWEEYGKENLQQKARVYVRLGLLAEGDDLPTALLNLRLSYHQGAYHDSRGKTLILPKEPLKPSPAFPVAFSTSEATTRQLLLIHELTNVLQEQHFHWEEKIRNRETEDSGLALRALSKGDVVLVALTHMMGNPKERQQIINGMKGLRGLPAQINKGLSDIPELLRQELSFQYLQGSEFVSWAYSVKGWEGVNALFLQPPLSTAQILHPEKFYLKRDDPIRITPWRLIREFGRKKIMEETLGEFLIQSLLSRTLPKEEASRAAAGWAGDSLLAFEQGDQLVLGWVTAWDDKDQALEFYRSYRRALEKRHGISLEPSRAGGDTLISSSQSGYPLLLQIKDHFVFFLDGIPAPRSLEIAAGLWNDLETGIEQEPLDFAARGLQPLPVKR